MGKLNNRKRFVLDVSYYKGQIPPCFSLRVITFPFTSLFSYMNNNKKEQLEEQHQNLKSKKRTSRSLQALGSRTFQNYLCNKVYQKILYNLFYLYLNFLLIRRNIGRQTRQR